MGLNRFAAGRRPRFRCTFGNLAAVISHRSFLWWASWLPW